MPRTTVLIIQNKKRLTSYRYIPKPILEMPGNPAALKFTIRGSGLSSWYKQVRSSRMPKVWIQTRSTDFAEEPAGHRLLYNEWIIVRAMLSAGH